MNREWMRSGESVSVKKKKRKNQCWEKNNKEKRKRYERVNIMKREK